MTLQPPFIADLTPEAEIARFREIQPRLQEVWEALMMRDEEPHTSVVVPSMTLDQSELRKIDGASFYEERLLFLLIRLHELVIMIVIAGVVAFILDGLVERLTRWMPRPPGRMRRQAMIRAHLPRPRARLTTTPPSRRAI